MLCAVCEAGWHRRGINNTCTECPKEMKDSLLLTAGLSTVVAIVVVVGVLLDLHFGLSKAKAGSQRLKLMVNCVQQITVMTLFPVEWPDAVKDMGAIFEGLSIDVTFVSPACLGVPINFYSRFSISAGIVFASIIVPWIIGALVSLVAGCRGGTPGHTRRDDGEAGGIHSGGVEGGERENGGDERPQRFGQKVRATWYRVQPTAARYSLIVMLFSHPAMSGQTFFFFSCQQIEDAMYVGK